MATKITTVITPYSTTPSRLKPATFSTDRDTRLAEENIRNSQLNNLADEINEVSDDINDKQIIATTKAGEATDQAALATQQVGYAAAEVAKAAAKVVLATQEASNASVSATLALQSKNEIAGLIELMPSDVNLAYSKAGTDALLSRRDLENFLDFKF